VLGTALTASCVHHGGISLIPFIIRRDFRVLASVPFSEQAKMPRDIDLPSGYSSAAPEPLSLEMTVMMYIALVAAAVASFPPLSQADEPDRVLGPPRVPIAFNRLYDYPELVEALRTLVAAHPDLLSMHSVGRSVEDRDIWCVTVNNPKTGPDRSKPAMYVDGNIHGNEVQAAEASLYLLWYLTENYGKAPIVTRLVDERAFYVLPTVNPDGRAWWFNGPNTTNSSRSGKSPLDEDRDGLEDEDGYDDLDGDGQITQMRRRDPHGRYKTSDDDPRLLVPVTQKDETRSDLERYELLGSEGIDNDGDGEVNEDDPGGYDMNRNWPADWQPDHVQYGAGPYPLCWPETRSVAQFVLDHPNIAGVQAYHNAAGMILRGPGHPSRQAEYGQDDDRIAEQIGDVGARLIPFYRNFVIHKDLYNVHGGFINWTYEHLGIFSYTNELWNGEQLLGRAAPDPVQRGGAGNVADQFLGVDELQHGRTYRPWTKVDHPLYGPIEVGGTVKETSRVPPSFLLEELCHRNTAFVLYHADQMPRMVWEKMEAKKLADGVYQVTAVVRNTRLIPTRSGQSRRRKVGLADRLRINGEDMVVQGGGILLDEDTGRVELAKHEPATLRLPEGVRGESAVKARWFVRGNGAATVRFESEKGGLIERNVTLE
jgi:Zinc carboxypeptidase